MTHLPDDPFGDDTVTFEDHCTAIGAAVLACFADGAEIVAITRMAEPDSFEIVGGTLMDGDDG